MDALACGGGGMAGWGQVKTLCTYGTYKGGCKATVAWSWSARCESAAGAGCGLCRSAGITES